MDNAELRDESISIRPGVSILSVLPHLNYRPWFAMAEFVDNSLQSFLDNRAELERVEQRRVRLEVSIELDPYDQGRITVRDNAAGIHEADYARAFRPAAVPPDRSGLSEFGMGMKSAACWFARKWTVRTKALGELIERTVHFDIDRIVRDDLEELQVKTKPVEANKHYTEIVLADLHNLPKGRTVGKIKEHLSSIYRIYTRRGDLLLRFDNEVLSYDEPRILFAPYYRDPAGASVRWRKEVDIDLGLGLRARGFAALRETASTSEAGFALFRRDRLIQGSADEGYRPSFIFGAPNSYTFQRLFGELHLQGFDVSHTKDGFQWQEHEDIFLELLKEELGGRPLPLLDQAEGHRVRQKLKDLKASAEAVTRRTADTLSREIPEVFPRQLEAQPDSAAPPRALVNAVAASRRVIDVELYGTRWEIAVELSADPAVGDWIELSDQPPAEVNPAQRVRRIGMRLSLVHPFMERFAGNDPARIEPLLRVAAGLMLGEVAARSSGVKQAGTIRRNMNELLRDALSKP